MDEFKHLIAAKLQDVSVQAELLLSEEERRVVSSVEDMRGEFDHLRYTNFSFSFMIEPVECF